MFFFCISRNSEFVKYLDAASAVAREYIRGCRLLERYESSWWAQMYHGYFDCVDYIHAGTVVVMHNIQTLLHTICK